MIVASAATVLLHHGILWWILPSSVFNYDAPFWVVGVHALFVVLESVVVAAVARSFFDNVIGLERKVQHRTRQLEARNNYMRMVLNSLQEGLLTIDPSGEIQTERSASVDKLLESIGPKDSFADVLGRHDPEVAKWLDLGLEEVFRGMLPRRSGN